MIMLIGPVGAGKTSLINVLQHNCRKAEKTQSICFSNGMIDTPGEYAQMPRFYSSLAVTAAQAKLIMMVQAAVDFRQVLPPGFAGMFNKPVVGVVTKIDLDGADKHMAAERLQQAGVRERFFYVSAHSGEGIAEIMDFLLKGGANSG